MLFCFKYSYGINLINLLAEASMILIWKRVAQLLPIEMLGKSIANWQMKLVIV